MTIKPLIYVKSQDKLLPSLQEGGPVSDNVVISFPSILGTQNGFGGEGERKCVESLLGDRHEEVTVLETSYWDWRSVEGGKDNEGANIIHKTNADPNYIPPEMTQFVEDYLRPLVNNGSNITLFGNSMGGVMIELARRALVKSYKQEGFNDADIEYFLRKVGGIAVASVLDVEKSQGVGFSMVYYAGTGDKIAQSFNPGFDALVNKHNKPITIRTFPYNSHSLLMTTATDSQVNDGHGITSFIEKVVDKLVPGGAVTLVRNVLQNSISPFQPSKNPWELCKPPQNQKNMPEQTIVEAAIDSNRRVLGLDRGQGRI